MCSGSHANSRLVNAPIIEVAPPVEPTVDGAAVAGATPAAPAASNGAAAPAAAANGKRGRGAWTRERVVEELGQWLIEVPSLDAAFLVRRGRASLVAAARRLFGRFDAALNAANLHLAELYPEGPPNKRARVPAAA